jgi:hypothetical protein
MEENTITPLFFLDFHVEGLDKNLPRKEVTFSGMDSHGRYKAQALVNQEDDLVNIIETRRYFYENGRIRRIARTLNDVMVKTEEWSEDGCWHRFTSYDEIGDWLGKKTIDLKTGIEKILINREAWMFGAVQEEFVRPLETGEFQSEQLFDVKWEDVREAILEILGAARTVPGLPMETIDQLGPNRLVKMEWWDMRGSPRMPPWCFLELCCTSTGKVSYLRVPPEFSDIMSAIAWTFGLNGNEYKPEVER